MNLRKILKKMGVGVAGALISFSLMAWTSFAATLPTEASVQQTQTAQPQTVQQIQNNPVNSQMVYLKVKAEVAEDFTAPINISYYGANGHEFSVSLQTENGYVTTIPVAQDAYTLKGLSSPAGIDMEIAKSFSLINAEAGKLYYLPVSVYQSTIQQEAEQTYINVKISAKEAVAAIGYVGAISVNYTGTNGNYFYATLTADNDYTMELQILKDIYSLNAITVESGYEADAMYSFDLSAATKENTYLLDVRMSVVTEPVTTVTEEVLITEGFQAAPTAPVVTAPTTGTAQTQVQTGTKNGLVYLSAPEGYNGNLIIGYTGLNGNNFVVSLNKSNSYTAIVSGGIKYDTYTLSQIQESENSGYAFSAPNVITVKAEDEDPYIITVSVSNKQGSNNTNSAGIMDNLSMQNIFSMIALIVLIIIAGVYGYKKLKGSRNDYSGVDDEYYSEAAKSPSIEEEDKEDNL